jgi:ABC-type transporter Mla MlaB component
MAAARDPIAYAVGGPIARADLPGLCDRICALLGRGGPGLALCDVTGVPVDAVTVDALARLQLGARRHGCRVQLVNASRELVRLLAFMGLEDVVAGGSLRIDSGGEPEEREEAVGGQEERELGDPSVDDVEHL